MIRECTVVCETHGDLASAPYEPDEDDNTWHEDIGICRGVYDTHTAANPECVVSFRSETVAEADARRAEAVAAKAEREQHGIDLLRQRSLQRGAEIRERHGIAYGG